VTAAALAGGLVRLPAPPRAAATAPQPTVRWAERVVAYSPGISPAQPFTQPELALGALDSAAAPGRGSFHVVSIGPGGSLVLGFDGPIVNHPEMPDLIVFGNAFYSNGVTRAHFQEPGLVEVAVDTNENGVADAAEPFYLLRGGMVPDPGWPPAFPLPPQYSGAVDHDLHPTRGYCDVTPSDAAGSPSLPDDPQLHGISVGSAGGDAFDLDWAVDTSGQPLGLERVHFIRIRCAMAAVPNTYAPGTASTEVDAVAVLPPPGPPAEPACRWELR